MFWVLCDGLNAQVLEHGTVIEQGDPIQLLKDNNSVLSSMVRHSDYGPDTVRSF